MERPSERLKGVATRLAAALTSEHGRSILLHLRQLSRQTAVAERAAGRGAHGTGLVGIWEPTEKDGETWFVRTKSAGEPTTFWADAPFIHPKRGRRRVVLIGESVARGFFFDPHLNASIVLQAILRAGAGQDVEVIDLARTDLMLGPLQHLAEAAAALEPDVLVVFAGNNWRPTPTPQSSLSRDLAAILFDGGSWRDVKQHLERVLHEDVMQGLGTLLQRSRTSGIPLVFVLPEFNLLDWTCDAENPSLLTSGETQAWHECRLLAERALADDDARRAEALGRRLVDLDGGCTPLGPRIIARAKMLAGAPEEARAFLEEARDAAIASPRQESPRCYTVIQDAVRQCSRSDDLLLVDLPLVFREHWQGSLPDRRMFLDYCHLTADAMHVAMAAVANLVLPHLGCGVRAQDLGGVSVPLLPSVAAEAHLLAAFHNANWGQPADIVGFHCRRALTIQPAVAELLTLILDFQTRRVPSALCRSFEALCERGNLAAINLLFNATKPAAPKFLNETLTRSALEALRGSNRGGAQHLDRLLRTEHAVDHRVVDLVNPAYTAESYRSLPDPAPTGFYRATTSTSRFRLVCDRPQDVAMTLTWRCRRGDADGSLHVLINGRTVTTLPGAREWSTVDITVRGDLLHAGINCVEVAWPRSTWDLPAWRAEIARALLDGWPTDLDPIYGEIHRFVTRVQSRATEEAAATQYARS